MIIDRMGTDMDDLWSRLDYKIFDSAQSVTRAEADEEENNSVVTAIEEPQTQKRLLDINLGISGRSSSSSLNNVLSSSNNRSRLANNSIHDNNNGRVSATPVGAVNIDDVIKSEATVAAAATSRNNLNKVLGRHSSNVEGNTTTTIGGGGGGDTIANQNNNKLWNTSTERLNPNSSSLTTSSGYLSQTPSAGLTASLSMEATVRGAGGELTRSLSLPMSSATVKAFQDVSASSALELRRAAAAGVITDTTGQQQQQPPADWESASVDNEDDMSLAELARKSGGPSNEVRSSQTEDELFAMIRKEWLHFRPKSSAELNGGVDSDRVPKISTMAPLDLEVVTLQTEKERNGTCGERDVDLPSSIFLNSEENLFHPQPFSLDDLEWKESPSSSVISSLAASPLNSSAVIRGVGGNALDQSLSGDSLNELSLNLGDDETGEDNEKVLENILQECQMGDLKILEDPTIFTGLQDTEEEEEEDDEGATDERKPAQLKNLFERAVGYESEFVSWALEIFGSEGEKKIKREATITDKGTGSGSSRWLRKAARRDLSKRRRKVGKSKFQLSRVTRKDETFSPDKNPVNPAAGDLTNSDLAGSSSGVVMAAQSATSVDGSVVTIKQEPDTVEDGGLQVHEIKIEKQEEMEHEMSTGGNTIVVPIAAATPTISLQQHQQQQQQQVQRQGTTTTRNILFPGAGNYLAQQGENTIILTSSLNSVKNHLNGPISEKTRKRSFIINFNQ